MKFKSKVDWWMYPVWLSAPLITLWLIVSVIMYGGTEMLIFTLIFVLFDALLILPMFFNTNYTFSDSELLIKSGLGKPLIVPYNAIYSIVESKNRLASAALSHDRVEIRYGERGVIYVSPENKKEFMSILMEKSSVLSDN